MYLKSNGILAFCGSKGSGKSTSYNLFKQLYKGEIEELAFAGHLKEVCSRVFNLDIELFINPKLKEKELENFIFLKPDHIRAIFQQFNVTNEDYDVHIRPHVGKIFYTPRQLLQYIGTDLLHPIDALIHIKITLKNKSQNKLSIVTDLRFLNEFNYLLNQKDTAFLAAYIHNNNAETIAEKDLHPSEQQIKLFKKQCVIIDNNSDLNNLSNKIKNLLITSLGEDYVK